jgi:hypothetical protein
MTFTFNVSSAENFAMNDLSTAHHASAEKSRRGILAWFDDFSVRTKLGIGLGAMLVPIMLSGRFLTVSELATVRVAENELDGVRYGQPLNAAMRAVAAHRRMSMTAAYEQDGKGAQSEAARRVDESLAAVTAVDTELAERWNLGSDCDAIVVEWRVVQAASTNDDATAIFKAHTDLIARMATLSWKVAGSSELALDPEAASSAFMDAAVLRMPKTLEAFLKMRSTAAAAAVRSSTTTDAPAILARFVEVGKARTDDLLLSLADATASSDAAKQAAGPAADAFLAAHIAAIVSLAACIDVNGMRAADRATLERLEINARSALLPMQAHDRLVRDLAAVCELLGNPTPGMPVRGAIAPAGAAADRGGVELF